MYRTKIFTAATPEGLEKDINIFLGEMTNAEVIQADYQSFQKDNTIFLSALIIYRIDHDATAFGAA